MVLIVLGHSIGITALLSRTIRLDERLESRVPTQLHPLDLFFLPGVHGNRSDEADVYTIASMLTGTLQADKYSEAEGGPLRTWVIAIAADFVFFSLCELL